MTKVKFIVGIDFEDEKWDSFHRGEYVQIQSYKRYGKKFEMDMCVLIPKELIKAISEKVI